MRYPFQNETWISNCGGNLFRIGELGLWLSQDLALPRPCGEHPRKRGSANAHGATYQSLESPLYRFHFGMGA